MIKSESSCRYLQQCRCKSGCFQLKRSYHHYLHVKNALANDNGGEAAGGAKAMERAISNLINLY
jgi:hypothetical protein